MAHEDGPSGIAGNGTDSVAPPQGTLIIRTWWEPDHPHGFRARVTATQPAGTVPATVVTADPEEVLTVVRRWLLARPGTAGAQ